MLVYVIFFAISFALCLFRNQAKLPYFLLFMVFVGFRFETGYDWPVYKDQFEITRLEEFWSIWDSVLAQQIINNQDLGYLIISFLGSKLFGSYELFQSAIAAFFILSVFRLGKALGHPNVILAITIASTLIMLSLEFSTLRQCLAISFFNFAICCFLDKRLWQSAFWACLAISTQFSAAIYVVIFLISVFTNKRIVLATVIGGVSVFAITLLVNSGIGLSILPANSLLKLQSYQGQNYDGGIFVDLFFFLLAITVICYCLYLPKVNHTKSEHVLILRKFTIFSALLMLMFLGLPTIRDRIAYEMAILFGFLAAWPEKQLQYLALMSRAAFVLLGTTYTANLLLGDKGLPFIPYQNYLVYQFYGLPSDGRARVDRTIELLFPG
jgi:EpsG family